MENGNNRILVTELENPWSDIDVIFCMSTYVSDGAPKFYSNL